jgi:phytoene desaturase
LSGADYHHGNFIDVKHRVYSYWDSRVFAPSSLLFYVGFDKKIENISHHACFLMLILSTRKRYL